MNKILFDTNVLLDFFLERNTKPEIIKKLFHLVDNKAVIGCVTISSLQICAFYLTPAKGVKATKSILEMIVLTFQLLEGNKKTLLTALKSHQKDVEDAIHYFIALENEMHAIVTSDKGFIKLSTPTLPIYSPADLLLDICLSLRR